VWGQVIFDSLAPVFLTLGVGVLLRRLRFLPDAFFGGLNKLAFWVALPCLLFHEIARCRVPAGDVMRASGVVALALIPLLLAGWVLARLLRVPSGSRGAFLQGGVRGNLAYVGIPVVAFALAHEPQAQAMAALALAPLTPLYNVLGVLLLLRGGAAPGAATGRWRPVLTAVATNPLILSCLLGLAAFAWQVRLPSALSHTIELLGRAGLPIALLALGASLTFDRVRNVFAAATAAALVRVALGPLCGWGLAAWFGLAGDLRTMALLFLACPTAVASYVMADQMGADKDLAGAIVALSTLYAFPCMAAVLLLAR
jgi:predicted permease